MALKKTAKTDNVSLPTKVALRSWLLRKMNMTEVRVLDACAGAGLVWSSMESIVTIRQWVRCDIKPRQAGTLEMSAAAAINALPLDTFDVIDVDPYGEPFDAYLIALRRLSALEQPHRVAVFLTHGCMNMTGTIAHASMRALGIPTNWPYPRDKSLVLFAAEMILRQTWRYATIEHSARVAPTMGVTYYALGLSFGGAK